MDTQRNMNSTLSWISLIIGVLALIISILAFNRTGNSLQQVVQDQAEEVADNSRQVANNVSDEVQETAQDIEFQIDRAAYIARLQAIKMNLQTQENVGEAEQQIAQLRQDIDADMERVDDSTRQGWQEVIVGLQQLETDARSNTAQAIQTIDMWLEMLEAEVSPTAITTPTPTM